MRSTVSSRVEIGTLIGGGLAPSPSSPPCRPMARTVNSIPRIEAGYLYDDNYRLTTPGNEIDVSGPLLDAEMEWRAITPTSEFSLTPRVRATYFPDASELDAVDYFANLDWLRQGQRVNTRVRGEFAHQDIVSSEQPDSGSGGDLGEPDVGDSGIAFTDNERTRYALRPQMSFDVSERRELQFDAGYTDVSFDREISNAQVDYNTIDAAAGLLTRLNETSTLTARAARRTLRHHRPGSDHRLRRRGAMGPRSVTETRSYGAWARRTSSSRTAARNWPGSRAWV